MKLKKEGSIYFIETGTGTKYYFDSYGRLDYIKDTDDNSTNISYDVNGNISTMSDASGRSITFSVSNGKLRTITGNEIPKVEYGYDASGNLTSVIKRDPSDQSILDEVHYAYGDPNDSHNITSVTDAENNSTDIEYYNNDKVRYIVKEMTTGVSTLTLITQYEYSSGPDNTIVMTVTNPRGNKVKYTTNPNGNLIEKIYDAGTDPGDFNLKSTLQWDAEQNLVQVNNPKNYSYIMGYNNKGDIEQLNVPYNYSSISHYNNTGDNIDNTEFSGMTNIINYSSENRKITSTSTPWFSTYMFDYNGYGNIAKRTRPVGIGANLLHNPGFENWEINLPRHWTRPNTGGSIINDTIEKVNGVHSVKMVSTGILDNSRARLQSKYIPIKPNNKYNISWHVKTANVGSTNNGATVSIFWYEYNTVGSPTVGQDLNIVKSTGTSDWLRKGARVNSPVNANFAKVEVSVNDTGTAWFDNIQLLLGSVINNYNLLINSNFEQLSGDGPVPDYWLGVGLTASDGVNTTYSHTGARSVVINGQTSVNKFFKQEITTKGPAGAVFRFSGWAKTQGTFTAGPYLGVELIYEDNDVGYFGVTFTNTQHDWEYKEGAAVAEKDFKLIRIYGKLENQTGIVWFDDFILRLNDAPNALINTFNIAENGSFEYDIDNTQWPDDWPKYTNVGLVPGTYDVSWIRATGDIGTYHGDKMIRISNVPSWAVVASYTYEPLISGKTYTACAAIKTENVAGSGAVVKFDIVDSNNNYLGEKRSRVIRDTNDWQRVFVTITESEARTLFSNASKIRVSVGTVGATSGTMYFDAVLLCDENVTTEYSYGNTNGNYITSITNPRGKKVNIVPTTRGNIAQINDPKNNTSTYEYNLIDQLKHSINARGLKTKFTYNENGYITRVDYINNSTSVLINNISITYNQLGLLLNTSDQLSRTAVFKYNQNTSLNKITKPDGGMIYLNYDGADRINNVNYSNDSRFWWFQYDDNSNITQITKNGTDVTAFQYDNLDRVTKMTYPDSTHYMNYVYNPSGQLLSITYSKIPSEPILFEYDQSGLNVKVTGPKSSNTYYMYDQEGRIVKSYRRTSSYTSYITFMYYDQTGNISKLRTENGGQSRIREYAYTYDNNGNRESEHNLVTGEYVTYSYDSVNQLIDERYYNSIDDQTPYRQGHFDYDLLGNLLQKTVILNGIPTSVSFTYNAANEVSKTGYSFDLNGNLISDGVKTYIYNASNQLILVKQGETTVAEYEYNALGLRTRKQTASLTEKYYYSGNQLSYILDSNGYFKFFFTYDASGQRLNMIDYTGAPGTEQTYWYEYDAHGNVIGMLDNSGNMVVTYRYDAWGNTLSSTGTVNTADGLQNLKNANPFRYSGYFYDPETEFYYLKKRYYTAYLQRFLTRDTFIGVNPYLYAKNNPVDRVDPNGNAWWKDAINWVKKTVEKAVKKVMEIIAPITAFKINKTKKVYYLILKFIGRLSITYKETIEITLPLIFMKYLIFNLFNIITYSFFDAYMNKYVVYSIYAFLLWLNCYIFFVLINRFSINKSKSLFLVILPFVIIGFTDIVPIINLNLVPSLFQYFID